MTPVDTVSGLLEQLQDGPEFRFRDWPNDAVPKVCAGVYTIWDVRTLIYAGMSGRSLTQDIITQRRAAATGRQGLFKRLRSHARGRRSGDQFCVYVADRLVLAALGEADINAIASGTRKFDAIVREYIHAHFSYRFVEVPDGAAAFALEARVRAGGLRAGKPFLNPSSVAPAV